jgi:hypothetical protein
MAKVGTLAEKMVETLAQKVVETLLEKAVQAEDGGMEMTNLNTIPLPGKERLARMRYYSVGRLSQIS